MSTPEKQKSFKLGMSKDANRKGLIGLGCIILIKILGPFVGSYLIAGLIAGILFAILDNQLKK